MNEKIILKGIPASQGIFEGIVRIVLDPKHPPEFHEGEILVAKVTEPSLVMLMNMAAAIVTDVGGITSHAAVVSRELGIPCVTATKTATSDLKEGQYVRVNGTTGDIFGI